MRHIVVVAVALAIAGCGGTLGSAGDADYGWMAPAGARARVGLGGLEVRWTEQLAPEGEGPYVPVERAQAALDPTHDRVYVGSTGGVLYAMTSAGAKIWRYDAGAAIEAAPAVDAAGGAVYVTTEDGVMHALDAATGEQKWRKPVGGPVRNAPILSSDTVYVVTALDSVLALDREDGEERWSYRRDVPEGFSITEHAGLVADGHRLLAAFTDGTVVALRRDSGQMEWERDTALDLEDEGESEGPRFVDVDTTPVVIGDVVYVASFAAGLYALERDSGTVLWREPGLTGIVGLAEGPELLVAVSADRGVMAVDPADRRVVWERRIAEGRGAPSAPIVWNGVVLVGESSGSLLSLDVQTGREVARIGSGHGFTAAPTVAGRYGFVVSNGGALFAFGI